MNRELSTYLNLLRVFGAVEVFFGHLCIWNTDCGFVGQLPWLGDDGVVTFFVLSGYLIAYTADQKDTTVRRYIINRCARVYSVALPALLLTIMLEWIGIKYFPVSYDSVFDHYQFAKIGLYIPVWLTFSSELWFLNEPIFTNGPFWSLCFEVWFYIFFGVIVFMRSLQRVLVLGIVALIAGPKICILSPVWALGVLAYHGQKRFALTPAVARGMLVLVFGAYILIKFNGIDDFASEGVNTALGNWPQMHLQMAWQFPGEILIAMCVAASILAMRFAVMPQLVRVGGVAGVLASFTFTIYLTHNPLLKFFVTAGGGSITSMLWPTIATLACVVLFGLCTEHRLGPWRTIFTGIVRASDKLVERAAQFQRNG